MNRHLFARVVTLFLLVLSFTPIADACIACDIGEQRHQPVGAPRMPHRNVPLTTYLSQEPLQWHDPVPVPTPAQRTPRRPALGAVEGRVGGPLGPSTSRFVEPNGCEAAHDQQFNPSGKYWGKYQYDKPSWVEDGGKESEWGNASRAEQDRVAANAKWDRWPNC